MEGDGGYTHKEIDFVNGDVRNYVSVPVSLLEHCLGVIQEVQKYYQASGNFTDDINLAVAQLRCAIAE